MKMGGLSKDEKSRRVLLNRGMKTLFFLITMLASLLIFSAPILLVITDALLPSALLCISNSSPASLMETISTLRDNYDFRSSLFDVPLISILRSAVIFCVYCMCDGPKLSRWPYLGITTLCSISSLVFVSIKASYVFAAAVDVPRITQHEGHLQPLEAAIFTCSLILGVAHVVVAYRTSCRERRKLLIFNIDIEAVSTCKKRFPVYQKKLLEEDRPTWTRMKSHS